MTVKEQQEAQDFHDIYPFRTTNQLFMIGGEDVVIGLCKHLRVSEGIGSNTRDFKALCKNLENKACDLASLCWGIAMLAESLNQLGGFLC